MNLYELAFTSYLYDSFTTYNKTLIELRNAVGNNIELLSHDKSLALIIWLNKWGCRQFSLKYRIPAAKELAAWYVEGIIDHISKSKKVWELTESELKELAVIYESLAARKACEKTRNETLLTVRVGATGASKILFAFRPEVAVPWDGYIRRALGFSSDGAAYINYLKRIVAEIEDLEVSCAENDIKLCEVPRKFNREYSTIPQLVGEYFWVTETKKCHPPDNEVIQDWAKWSKKS